MCIAIKGHATRSQEVIEILEMLGGVNNKYWEGSSGRLYYSIGIDNFGNKSVIIASPKNSTPDCMYFTLDEFLEKYPYKVGDKVEYDSWPCVIQEMCWDSEFKEVRYTVKGIDFCKYCSVNDLKRNYERNN